MRGGSERQLLRPAADQRERFPLVTVLTRDYSNSRRVAATLG